MAIVLSSAGYESDIKRSLAVSVIFRVIYYNVPGESTFPFPNFNGCTIELWEWISNFIPRFTGHVITYTWWDLS